MIGNKFRCQTCGANERHLQVSLPGWYRPDDLATHIEADEEAEALAWYCEKCDDTVSVVVTTDTGEHVDSGRWAVK